MDRLELPGQRDRRITAVLGELADLRRRIGELGGELARLKAERRQTPPASSRRSDGTAGVAVAPASRTSQTARAVARPAGTSKRARRDSRATKRRPPAVDGRRRFVGPIATSLVVHLVALAVMSAFFIPVESPRPPVTITLSAVGAETSLDEAAMVEFESPVESTKPVQADDVPEPESNTPPLVEAADPQPLVEAADPPRPTPEAPPDAALVDAASAGEASGSAAVASEATASGAGELSGGKPVAAARPRTAPRGKQATAFFGRVGQGKSVCFICDNSNSYRDGRFHAVLDELMRAIQGLRPEQSFFVIFTSDAVYPLFHPRPVEELQPATPENKHKLRAWLDTVEMCRGGQGIDDAVRLAATLDADCVYLLSDGEMAAATVHRLQAADFGGASVHTFGMQGSIIDTRSGQVDRGKFLRQEECNRNLASIAAAHGGTFTPVIVPAAAAVLERLRPIPRNRSRGAVWGLRL
jgi:hypothetical protein